MDWFDITKLDERTYIISENKHYEETNIYFIIGQKFNICIDCGMGLHKIGDILDRIDSKERRLIVTHSHWDHIGNWEQFSKVYLHKKAKEILANGGLTPLKKVRKDLIRDINEKDIPKYFNINNYKIYNGESGIELINGQTINLDDRQLEIIYTPGHTAGSISVYEKDTGYLFVGDFLYSGALYCTSDNNDPEDYYKSLHKIVQRNDKITKILSGHYEADLGKDYISKMYQLFVQLKEAGKLSKGTGNYKYNGMEIVL